MPGCPSVTLLADLAVFSVPPDKGENGEPYQRRKGVGASLPDGPPAFPVARDGAPMAGSSSWRRIMLMILAITIHNIPGKSHPSVHPILTCGQPLPRVDAILGRSDRAAAFSSFFFFLLFADGTRRVGAWVPFDKVYHVKSRSFGRAEPRKVLAAKPLMGRGLGGSPRAQAAATC